MQIFVGILGGLLIVIVLWDAFETIILPRRAKRRFRLTAAFFRATWRPWVILSRGRRSERDRDHFLGYYGPLSMLLLLVIWAVGMIVGFAMLQWAGGSALRATSGGVGIAEDLYDSGSNYFTLGLGDVAPRSNYARALTVIEAGLGFGFLAIVVAYLPVLYSAFSRREVNISLMDARAGSPSTAMELLRRYGSNIPALDATLQDFERWTAELLESYISFPVLTHFRSQHTNQSWLSVITTILDTCSLVMVGLRNLSPWQAQLTFAIARHAVVDVAQILSTPPRPPVPERLSREDFARLFATLCECQPGIPTEGSYERLAELRMLYEPYVYALSEYLEMRLPPWVSGARVRHNWQTSAWGRIEIPPEAM